MNGRPFISMYSYLKNVLGFHVVSSKNNWFHAVAVFFHTVTPHSQEKKESREKSGPLLENICKGTLMTMMVSYHYYLPYKWLIDSAHCEYVLHLSAIKHNPPPRSFWTSHHYNKCRAASTACREISLREAGLGWHLFGPLRCRWILTWWCWITRDCPHLQSCTVRNKRQFSHQSHFGHNLRVISCRRTAPLQRLSHSAAVLFNFEQPQRETIHSAALRSAEGRP